MIGQLLNFGCLLLAIKPFVFSNLRKSAKSADSFYILCEAPARKTSHRVHRAHGEYKMPELTTLPSSPLPSVCALGDLGVGKASGLSSILLLSATFKHDDSAQIETPAPKRLTPNPRAISPFFEHWGTIGAWEGTKPASTNHPSASTILGGSSLRKETKTLVHNLKPGVIPHERRQALGVRLSLCLNPPILIVFPTR